MRPANIVTAFADILAGFAIGFGYFHDSNFHDPNFLFHANEIHTLIWLLTATFGLYGGGVVFNDYFDAELDKIERPERPIPSGMASKTGAMILGLTLLFIGFISAFQVNYYSFIIALSIGVLAIVYDKFSKHHTFAGPFNMGLCRAGNLLLGLSALPMALESLWLVGIIPIVFVAAITFISQGEVKGGKTGNLWLGLVFYLLVFGVFLFLFNLLNTKLLYSWPFLALLIYLALVPLVKAIKLKQPADIRKAVKAGVLSLVVLNATLAAAFNNWQAGLLILVLLPVSMGLARVFAVT